ncbi:lantibiotic dehydratase [Effusibacillus consociatus]|uniref:Lantibiotic dehydratase n=1 Tax=Effusibacillus consociatus TaxID=1117041 RepID=A0ABV9Q052_9BACL
MIQLFPKVMIRIAPVAIDILNKLQMNKTLDLIEEIECKEKELNQSSERLLNLLYPLIGAEQDYDAKKQLLKLRKSIANNKNIIIDYESLPLPADLSEQVRAWIGIREQLAGLGTTLQETFESEYLVKREYLQELANNDLLMHAISLSSDSLYTKWPRYLETPISQQERKLKKIERSVLLYLTRMIAKTSPFSTFTMVGLGELSEDWDVYTLPQMVWKSNVQVNNMVAIYIWELITKSDIRFFLPLAPNKHLRTDPSGGNLIFLSVERERITTKFLKQNEKWGTLPYNEQVNQICQYVKYNKVVVEDLVQLLMGKEAEHSQVLEYLEKLIEMGLLEYQVPFCEQNLDYLEDIYKHLCGVANHPEVPQDLVRVLMAKIARFKELVARYNMKERDELKTAIEEAYSELVGLLDESVEQIKPLFYEDCFVEHPMQVPRALLDRFLQDVGPLQKIFPLFDTQLPTKLFIKEIFLKTYGEDGVCENILRFQQAVQAELGAQPQAEETPAFVVGKLVDNPIYQQWKELREELFRKVFAGFDHGSDVQFDASYLEQVAFRIPSELALMSPNSWSYFLQPISQHGEFVINKLSDGHGRFMSRFMGGMSKWVDMSLNEMTRHHIKETEGEETIWAELNGVFGFNANLHPDIVDYEVVYPGIQSSKPPEKQIDLRDILICYDKESRQLTLYSKSRGKKIRLLYLQFLNLKLLPPLFRFLIYFSQLSNPDLAFHESYYYSRYPQLKEQDILYFPRVKVNGTILKRRQWWVEKDSFLRAIGASHVEGEYLGTFIALRNWLRKHEIPERFYIRANLVDQFGSTDAKSTYQDGMRKPQYIDSRNITFIKVLLNQVQLMNGRLIIEEALPTQETLPVQVQGKTHMIELLVETYNKGGL